MKRRKGQPDRPKVDTTGDAGLTANPFAKLGQLRDQLPTASDPETEPSAAGAETNSERSAAPARVVIRYERKGRGGKEVTVVERLSLSPAELDHRLTELKRSLGCGGVREGDTLVLQGDQRDRLRGVGVETSGKAPHT